jgi:hypothetical protein
MAIAMPKEEFTEDSKRGHERLVAYWQSLKADKRLPTETQVEPSAISDLWDSMFLLNTNKETSDYFRYEYMGGAMIEAYGVDLTGKVHDEYTEPNVKSIMRSAAEIAKTGQMAIDESEFVNKQGDTVKYRCSLVPLAADNDVDRVHFILGFMRWKIV